MIPRVLVVLYECIKKSRTEFNLIIHVKSSLSCQSYYRVFQKKTIHSWKLKTLGTSYSETTKLLDLKLWQQGVLMSTPCCQISTVYRLLVSEYEVSKVLSSQEWIVFFETPCSSFALKRDPFEYSLTQRRRKKHTFLRIQTRTYNKKLYFFSRLRFSTQ